MDINYRGQLLLLLLFLFSSSLLAQKFIAIDKGGKNKRIRYYTGDYIYLKKKDKTLILGTVAKIDSLSFVVGSDKVVLKDVAVVIRKNMHYGLGIISRVCFTAGVGFLGIDTGNRLINNETPTVRGDALRLAGTLIGISAASRFLSSRRIKINKRHPIKIIDISI